MPKLSTTAAYGCRAPIRTTLWSSPGAKYHMLYSIPVSIFPRQSNGDNCSITHFGDTCLFTLNDGLGIVDMASIYSPHPAFRLRIKAIGSYDAQGKFVRLPLKSDEVPVLADNNMQLILSYPNYDHTPYRYRFRIDGDEQSDTLSVLPEMTYHPPRRRQPPSGVCRA